MVFCAESWILRATTQSPYGAAAASEAIAAASGSPAARSAAAAFEATASSSAMRKVGREIVAALAERLLMGIDHAYRRGVARARHQRMANRQQHFADDHQRRVDQKVERQRHRSLGRILDRHHAEIGARVVERLEYRRDRGLRRELGAGAETHPRCLVRISVLGAEVGDAQRMLERGAGRDYLDEDAPQMLADQRTRIELDHPVEHLALARRLVDRGAARLLEMSDRLSNFRALVEQAHKLHVDRVDLRAQAIEPGQLDASAGFAPAGSLGFRDAVARDAMSDDAISGDVISELRGRWLIQRETANPPGADFHRAAP